MPVIQVAIDVPLPKLFDYAAPAVTRADIGCRVRVPFGPKQVVGIILGITETPSVERGKLRPAGAVLRDMPPLSEDLLQLLRFCSDYYHHPIGEVVHNALPAHFRTLDARRARIEPVRLTVAGRAALDAGLKRFPALRRILMALCDAGVFSAEHIQQLPPRQRQALKRALDNGWAERAADAGPLADAADAQSSPTSELTLTPEQQSVLVSLGTAAPGFRAWLLHGVTGSGKTEIYLQAMAGPLARGDQVLLLVPEIALTPQLEARIKRRFPERPLVTMHSNLAAGQRAAHWLKAHAGEAKIVLGTRSALFAPLPQLALIVVDEEHDASFKQMDGVRYSARDLAVWRARQRSIPVILGSATPSLETFHSALSGRYRMLRLQQRANAIALPAVRTVPIERGPAHDGLSPHILGAIDERLSRREQALVFINRRGYAPVLVCSACAWAPQCKRCSARLVLHKPKPRLTCHHCGHVEPVPTACADCGNADLYPLGYGTQRIESILRAALPQATVLRVDRDTTRGRHSWTDMRTRIERREVDILIGTQLLAKGHDFANLGLVCVLNADQSLYSSDFRAEEQLFAQLIQVAGRAGRGEVRGEVLIQTQFPAHPLYQAVKAHDFDGFARTLLEERSRARLPPFVYQAVLRAEAARMENALDFLHAAAKAASEISPGVTVFDPTPATLQRLKGRERAQLLVQSESRPQLHGFLEQWVAQLYTARSAGARWSLDVDPLGI
jgi:primosomal protein N' (replication factor Y)